MPQYTIREVIGTPNQWSNSYGTMLAYSLDVTGDDGFTGQVEWSRKETSPAPTVGQVVDGTLDKSNPKYAPKLKMAQGGGGAPRGGGGGKSQADQDSIERSVAYKGAVDLCVPGAHSMSDQQLKARLTVLFEHGLSLIQGKSGAARQTPPPPNPPVTPPASDETPPLPEEPPDQAAEDAEAAVPLDAIKLAYKLWAMTQENENAAKTVFANKLTSLGISGVADANAEQRKAIRDFLNAGT